MLESQFTGRWACRRPIKGWAERRAVSCPQPSECSSSPLPSPLFHSRCGLFSPLRGRIWSLLLSRWKATSGNMSLVITEWFICVNSPKKTNMSETSIEKRNNTDVGYCVCEKVNGYQTSYCFKHKAHFYYIWRNWTLSLLFKMISSEPKLAGEKKSTSGISPSPNSCFFHYSWWGFPFVHEMHST